MTVSTQHVYEGHGALSVRESSYDDLAPAETRVPSIADTVPASWIMTRDVVCAHEDLDVESLVELMVRRHIGSVPIVDREGVPVGMVTKHDLVEQLLAARDPDAQPVLVARQLMMPLAFTLDEHATVAHAAALMSVEGIHHVPVVEEGGRLIGLVSTFDVVRWLATNDGLIGASDAPPP